MNKVFKEYHARIDDLTDNTEHLFNRIINIPDEVLGQHTGSMKILATELKSLHELVVEVTQEIYQNSKEFSYALLYLNNLRQNISTLKLIITNIQLEPQFRNLYNELINVTIQLHECSKNLTEELLNTQKRIELCTDILLDVRDHQLATVIQGSKRILESLVNLREKKHQCSEYKKILKELIARKSSSSAEIITNLQFQDIVRQKIEHVHAAQMKLLEKLQDFSFEKKADLSDPNRNMAKIIIQIRNIGSLQAAQLVHANNEYQKSVEVIITKFGELDTILTEAIKFLSLLSPKNHMQDGNSISEIKKLYSYFELEFDTFFKQKNQLEHTCGDIFRKEEQLSDSKEHIMCSLEESGEMLRKLDSIIRNQERKATVPNPLTQITGSFKEIRHNSIELSNILEKNRNGMTNELKPKFLQLFAIIKNIHEKIRILSNDLQSSLPQSVRLSDSEQLHNAESELADKKFDLRTIRYYTIFDKEIEIIISNINDLISSIDFAALEKKLDAKSLQEIEKLYTMKSERVIHAKITGNDSQVEGEQTGNDIELF